MLLTTLPVKIFSLSLCVGAKAGLMADAHSKRLSFAGKPIVVPPILTRARYKEVKPALIIQFIRFVFCLGPSHGKCS
jgi:hypothetical protein